MVCELLPITLLFLYQYKSNIILIKNRQQMQQSLLARAAEG